MNRQVIAELIGTFALVFAGTGAIVVNDVSGGQLTHLGVALTFGLVVMAMVFAFGAVSGAHLNPAVTLGLASAGQAAWKTVPAYIGAQATGAVLASLLVSGMFPSHRTLGATIPAGSAGQSFVMETVLTFLLMVVVLSVATDDTTKVVAPFSVGGVVALDALFGGPVSGASMNPARSLGPALVSLKLTHLWLYVLAPCCGALLAVATWRFLVRSQNLGR